MKQFRPFVSLRIACLPIISFALLLSGCGGGGGGTTGQNSTLPSFNNGKVGPVTSAQIAAAETAIDNMWANGINGSQAAATDDVLAEMSKLPIFRAGGVTRDGGIWGQYTNGTEVLYITNDPDWSGNGNAKAPFRSKPVTSAKPIASGEISGSANAYVIVSMEPARNSAGPQIASELSAAGFNVISSVGHLSDWSAVTNAGVLFANSHGMYDPHLGQYYQVTADVPSDALNTQYAAQALEATIILGRVLVNDTNLNVNLGNRKEGVDFHFEWRYAFDAHFLTNSSMFAKNSIMVDNACSGMEDGGNYASYLENQLGLSVFSGWTNSEVSSDSAQSSLFLFDRLLGLNNAAPVDPIDPPPATWSDVLSTMQSTTRPDRSYNFVTSTDSATQASELSFRASSSSQLQTIIPSIATAQLDSSGKTVTITGYFGSTKGTVKFNGSYMTISSWSSGSIVVTAPTESEGVIVVEGVVTGGQGYLNSNSYNYSNVTLSPHNPVLALGAQQTFTATGQIPANAKFEWTLDGEGSIGSSKSVTTTSPTIAYTASNSYTTDDLTVKVVNSSGDEVGSGSDTISVSSNLVLSPSNPELLPQQQQAVTLSAAKGSLPAGVRFKWTLSGVEGDPVLGSLAGSNTVTTAAPSVTYTAPNGLGKDNLQVQLIDSSGDVEGTTTTTLTTSVQLVVTPASATLATGANQTFVASAAQGHIPPLPNYGVRWKLTGGGDIDLSSDTLILTYTAPSTAGNSTLVATLQGPNSDDYGSVTIPIVTEQSGGITPASYTFSGPGQGVGFDATGTFPTGTTYKWSCESGGLATAGTAQPFPKTLVTTTPTVTYMVANPPADGSSAADSVSLSVIGPTGATLGGGSAAVLYGGTAFFVGNYPYTQDNDKIVTGDVSSTDMRTLSGSPTNIGQSYGIEDLDGFFQVDISAASGTALTAGQTYSLFEQSPISEIGVFYLGGYIAENSPPMKSGTLTIASVKPVPGENANFIGFSINVLCGDGQSIVGNGVVVQHF